MMFELITRINIRIFGRSKVALNRERDRSRQQGSNACRHEYLNELIMKKKKKYQLFDND
jgi:hypothetical protein